VSGNECHRITEAARVNRNAFSALFRGSNTWPSFMDPHMSSQFALWRDRIVAERQKGRIGGH
jgi:hypothetical protein